MGGMRVLVGFGILLLSAWTAYRLTAPTTVAQKIATKTPVVPDAAIGPVGAATSDAGVRRSARSQTTPALHPLTEALCPDGMAWVEGAYCPSGAVAPTGCKVTPRELGVCMDRHEYPNHVGVLPAVMLHFREAARVCKEEGKRLCTESEWTHACRATVAPTECNFGRTTKEVRVSRLWDPREISAEVAAQDARRKSGYSGCVSPASVFDLPGNVQEWVLSEHPSGYQAALKGGRYNQSLIDCERSVQVRHVHSRFPHTGLRCCRDPLVRVPGGR